MNRPTLFAWRRHDMESIYALLVPCDGNTSVTGANPQQKVTKAELYYLCCCQLEQAIQQTIELLVIWPSFGGTAMASEISRINDCRQYHVRPIELWYQFWKWFWHRYHIVEITFPLLNGISQYISALAELMHKVGQWMLHSLSRTVHHFRICYLGVLANDANHLYSIHYNDIIMDSMASQITSLTIVFSAVYSGADQRKHQSFAPPVLVRGIPVNSPHKWPVTRKMFPLDDVIMHVRLWSLVRCSQVPFQFYYSTDVLTINILVPPSRINKANFQSLDTDCMQRHISKIEITYCYCFRFTCPELFFSKHILGTSVHRMWNISNY